MRPPGCHPATRISDETGVALVIALLCLSLMTALSMALMLNTTTETRIVANRQRGAAALYAAEAALDHSVQELGARAGWDAVLDGTARSAFTDGAAAGARRLPDGRALDLTRATNRVRCGKPGNCTDAELDAVTDERPWGANNPRWQLYASGPLDALLPAGSLTSGAYVVVWVADDPTENDGLPQRDGVVIDGIANPGTGRIVLLAEAHGAGGTRRAIEMTIGRSRTSGLRILSWRDVR